MVNTILILNLLEELMKTRLILSIVILFLIAGPLQIVQATTDIENTIQTQLGNQNISVSLRDVDSGELIYMKNGDVAMKPASTLKLLTASAALEMLGPDYRFQTKLYIDGEVEGKC